MRLINYTLRLHSIIQKLVPIFWMFILILGTPTALAQQCENLGDLDIYVTFDEREPTPSDYDDSSRVPGCVEQLDLTRPPQVLTTAVFSQSVPQEDPSPYQLIVREKRDDAVIDQSRFIDSLPSKKKNVHTLDLRGNVDFVELRLRPLGYTPRLPRVPIQNTSASSDVQDSTVTLTWNRVTGAPFTPSEFQVYQGSSTDPESALKTSEVDVRTGQTQYSEQLSLDDGEYFWIRAVNGEGDKTQYSEIIKVKIHSGFRPPTGLKTTLKGFEIENQSVLIQWNSPRERSPADSVLIFRLFRKSNLLAPDTSRMKKVDSVPTVSRQDNPLKKSRWSDSKLDEPGYYCYSLKFKNESGKSTGYSEVSCEYPFTRPQNFSAESYNGKIKIKWSYIPSVDSIEIYRLNMNDANSEIFKFSLLSYNFIKSVIPLENYDYLSTGFSVFGKQRTLDATARLWNTYCYKAVSVRNGMKSDATEPACARRLPDPSIGPAIVWSDVSFSEDGPTVQLVYQPIGTQEFTVYRTREYPLEEDGEAAAVIDTFSGSSPGRIGNEMKVIRDDNVSPGEVYYYYARSSTEKHAPIRIKVPSGRFSSRAGGGETGDEEELLSVKAPSLTGDLFSTEDLADGQAFFLNEPVVLSETEEMVSSQAVRLIRERTREQCRTDVKKIGLDRIKEADNIPNSCKDASSAEEFCSCFSDQVTRGKIYEESKSIAEALEPSLTKIKVQENGVCDELSNLSCEIDGINAPLDDAARVDSRRRVANYMSVSTSPGVAKAMRENRYVIPAGYYPENPLPPPQNLAAPAPPESREECTDREAHMCFRETTPSYCNPSQLQGSKQPLVLGKRVQIIIAKTLLGHWGENTSYDCTPKDSHMDECADRKCK